MDSKKTTLAPHELDGFIGGVLEEGLKAENAIIAGHKYYTTDSDKKTKTALWYQWVKISLKEIENANTYKEAMAAWEAAPTMSFVKCMAFEKMLSLTEDVKKIVYIFRAAPHDSLVRYLAFEKLQSLK